MLLFESCKLGLDVNGELAKEKEGYKVQNIAKISHRDHVQYIQQVQHVMTNNIN